MNSKSPRRRTVQITIGALLALVLAGVIAAPAQVAAQFAPGSSMSDSRDPVYAKGHAQASAEQERWRARRSDPRERRRREASREAHRGLGREAALNLARERFPKRFARDASEPVVLPNGMRIGRFLADDSATVETALGEAKGVVMSMTPIGVERDGKLTQIKLGLERRGDSFVPATPGRPYSLPARADGLARLDGSGVGFRAGAATSAEATIFDGRLFFADGGGQDTDYILEPRPAGAEAFWQLRSDLAPESFRLDFELPQGARIELAGATADGRSASQGAVVVGADGTDLATVTPPIAYDADGTRVDVETTVDGSSLVMRVKHRGEDLAYPVLLDPQVAEVWGRATGFNGCGTSGTGGAWSAEQWYSNGWGYAFNCDARSLGWGYGLYSAQYTNGYYVAGTYAQWNWYPPQDAFIDYVFWDNTRHQTAYDSYGLANYTYAFGGIFDNRCCWRAYTEWGNNAHWSFDQWANADIDNTRAVYGIKTTVTGSYYDPGLAGLEGAYIIVNDNYAPADIHLNSFVAGSTGLQASTIGSPHRESAWVDPNLTPIKISAHAWDRGLGLKSVSFVRTAATGTPLWGPFASNCNGSKSSPCPTSVDTAQTEVTGAKTMPEGIWEAKVVAADINDKVGYGYDPVNLKIDRSAPSISFSGYLYDQRRTALAGSNYSFTVTARDGDPSSLALQRSGAKRIDVALDGVALPSTGDTGCAVGSCQKSRTVTLADSDYPNGVDGLHTITATAYDQLGHASTATFQFFLDRSGASTSDLGAGDGGEVSDSAWGEPTAAEECTMDASSPDYCAAGKTGNTSFMDGLNDPPIEDAEETSPTATASSGSTTTTTPRPKYGIAHYDGSFLDGASNPNALADFRALKVRRVRTLVPWDLFDYSRNNGVPNDVQNRDLTNFRSFLSGVASYNGTYSSTPLTMIIGINASGDRAFARSHIPARSEYRTNFQKIRDYIKANYPQAKASYFEAWNEPNDAGHTLRDHPGRAAELWVDADDLCGTECTVLAGDFTDNGQGGGAAYFQSYRKRLLELRTKLPVYWGYHPYKYGLHATDGYLRRFKSFVKAAGKNARIWFTEYGGYERFRTGDLAEPLQSTQLKRTIGLPAKAGTKRVFSLLYYSWVSNQQGYAYDTGLLNNNGTETKWNTLTNGSANDDIRRPVFNTYMSYTAP